MAEKILGGGVHGIESVVYCLGTAARKPGERRGNPAEDASFSGIRRGGE